MSGHSRRQINRVTFYVMAIGALAADQISKMIARSALELGHGVHVIPGFFTLRRVENPGAAFGAFGSWPPLLILIGIVAIFAIIALRRERHKSGLLASALGLLLGGAAGNLIDRIRFGTVTDFLDFGVTVGGWSFNWPTFNVADIAIVAGVFLLTFHVVFVERDVKRDETPAPERSNN